jgi:hypothetical protein
MEPISTILSRTGYPIPHAPCPRQGHRGPRQQRRQRGQQRKGQAAAIVLRRDRLRRARRQPRALQPFDPDELVFRVEQPLETAGRALRERA